MAVVSSRPCIRLGSAFPVWLTQWKRIISHSPCKQHTEKPLCSPAVTGWLSLHPPHILAYNEADSLVEILPWPLHSPWNVWEHCPKSHFIGWPAVQIQNDTKQLFSQCVLRPGELPLLFKHFHWPFEVTGVRPKNTAPTLRLKHRPPKTHMTQVRKTVSFEGQI